MKTLGTVLWDVRTALNGAGISDPSIESDVLVMEAVQVTREQLYVSLDRMLDPYAARRLNFLVDRRLSREPTAYILGRKEFYGLDFNVSTDVLIPRPETEHLVDEALKILSDKKSNSRSTVLDVGTGCGAIAIALALHSPKSLIIGLDQSEVAIQVAKSNRSRYSSLTNLEFVVGDLLACFKGTVEVVVANLPYVETSQIDSLAPEIRLYEPLGALDGGVDGLVWIRKIIEQSAGLLGDGGSLLLELDPHQVNPVREFVQKVFNNPTLETVKDLQDNERVLIVTNPYSY